MQPNFQRLSADNNVLIAAYAGAAEYVFKVPANATSVGAGAPRAFDFFHAVTKATPIDPSADYLRLEKSPDDGTTWFGVLAGHDDASAANFLAGKSGLTGVALVVPVLLWPGQQVRLTASAGLTLVRNGFTY